MSKNGESRLDVPGFSYGVKTGEYIDVPKLFGGKPQPKRSGKPHGMPELLAGRVVSRARKAVQRATEIAKEDYFRKKRVRLRQLKGAITNHSPVQACNRRFFEYMGMKAGFIPFVEEPELIISRPKLVYELTDGFTPIVTTTSAREAMFICASLARYGIAVQFTQLAITQYRSSR